MTMAPDIDVTRLPAPAQKVLRDDAPAPMKMMAARGLIPGLKPAELVTVVAALALDGDSKLCELAIQTIAKLPSAVLHGALSGKLAGSTLDCVAEIFPNDHEVIERLLRQPQILSNTLEKMAERADEKAGELIATNEALMLKNPTAIEKLYLNKRVRMSTADRLLELAVRNHIELKIPAFREAAQAIQNELIPEASEEPTFDDLLFQRAESVAAQAQLTENDEDTHSLDDEGKEQIKQKFLPLHTQIAQMTVSQKIRRAVLGSAAERLILVRDSNKLVAQAVAKSPMLREDEAARITGSRSVDEAVLRIIARNREFTRNYQVKLNLVTNPRTPFTFSSRLIPHLRDNDLRAIARSKNVPGAISQAVKQQLLRKQGKR